jgi:signal transduction histidine kinase
LLDASAVRRAAHRIGLRTAVAVAVVVVVLGAVAALVIVRAQQHADDVLLRQVTDRVNVRNLPAGTWLVIQHGDRETATGGLPSGLPDRDQLAAASANRTELTERITGNGRDYRVDTTPLNDGGVAQAVLDLTAEQAERARLLVALVAMGATGLVLSAALGYQTSRWVRTLMTDVPTPHAASPIEPVPLQELMAEAIESVQPQADERGVTVDHRTIDDPPPVPGTRAGLSQAVLALLDNAIRYADSHVTVTVGASGHDVVIDISHDGPGISPDVMVSLFDRATMAHQNGPRQDTGLASVSEIIARHGGTVSVVHTSGSGAALRLRLPTWRG